MAATLTWQGDLRFEASSRSNTLILDGDSVAAGLDEIRVVEGGDRAEQHPHRLIAIRLNFVLHGDVPGEAVERAIALSREKYCSVSTSLRQDIPFVTSYEVVP